jgi:hypothetical protein
MNGMEKMGVHALQMLFGHEMDVTRSEESWVRNWSRWVPVAHVVSLATWEAEMKRINIQNQPRQILPEILCPKYLEQNGLKACLKQQLTAALQVWRLEFKLQYHGEKNKRILFIAIYSMAFIFDSEICCWYYVRM